MEERGQFHVPSALFPWKKAETHWTEGWLNPRVGLDNLVKRNVFQHCWDSNPPPSNPYPSHYTDYLPIANFPQYPLPLCITFCSCSRSKWTRNKREKERRQRRWASAFKTLFLVNTTVWVRTLTHSTVGLSAGRLHDVTSRSVDAGSPLQQVHSLDSYNRLPPS